MLPVLQFFPVNYRRLRVTVVEPGEVFAISMQNRVLRLTLQLAVSIAIPRPKTAIPRYHQPCSLL